MNTHKPEPEIEQTDETVRTVTSYLREPDEHRLGSYLEIALFIFPLLPPLSSLASVFPQI